MLIQQHTGATTWLGDRMLRVSAQKQKYYKTNSLQLKSGIVVLQNIISAEKRLRIPLTVRVRRAQKKYKECAALEVFVIVIYTL